MIKLYGENMCEKKFDIPKLNQEQWDDLQEHLSMIGDLTNELYDIDNKNDRYSILDTISIYMSEIDIILGRTYTQEEIKDIFKL